MLFVYAFAEITPILGKPLIDLRGEAPITLPSTYKDGGAGGKSFPSHVTKSHRHAQEGQEAQQ